MSVGMGAQELVIIVGFILGLSILGAVIYAVTKGSGKGPGSGE